MKCRDSVYSDLRLPAFSRRGGVGVEIVLRIGDRVMAVVTPSGAECAYFEITVVPVGSVAPGTERIQPPQASTFPLNGLTARLALDTLGLEKGSILVVTGAVDTKDEYAVQLAKKDGLTVIADAERPDEERVTGLEPISSCSVEAMSFLGSS